MKTFYHSAIIPILPQPSMIPGSNLRYKTHKQGVKRTSLTETINFISFSALVPVPDIFYRFYLIDIRTSNANLHQN